MVYHTRYPHANIHLSGTCWALDFCCILGGYSLQCIHTQAKNCPKICFLQIENKEFICLQQYGFQQTTIFIIVYLCIYAKMLKQFD